MKIDLTQVRTVVMSCNREVHIERRRKTLLTLTDTLGFSEVESVIGPVRDPYFEPARETFLKTLPNLQTPFIIFEDDATVTKNFYPILEIPEDTDILFLGGVPIGNRAFTGNLASKSFDPDVITNQWGGVEFAPHSAEICYKVINDDFVRVYNMYSAYAILFLTEKGKNHYIKCVNRLPLIPHDLAFSYGMHQINTLMVARPFFYEEDTFNSERTKQVIYTTKKEEAVHGEFEGILTQKEIDAPPVKRIASKATKKKNNKSPKPKA